MTPTNQGLQIKKNWLSVCSTMLECTVCQKFFLKKPESNHAHTDLPLYKKIWVMLRIQKPHNVLCEHSGDNNIQH
jgi:hypothetical protein